MESSRERDIQILHRLLYRNKNQHGQTKIFKYLQKLEDLLKLLPEKTINRLRQTAESCLRELQRGAKVTRKIIVDSAACIKQLNRVIRTSIEAVEWCSRGALLLRDQLSVGLFVPLYTTWLSLCSSFLKYFAHMLTPLERQHSSLRASLGQLQNALPQHSDFIAQSLVDTQLMHRKRHGAKTNVSVTKNGNAFQVPWNANQQRIMDNLKYLYVEVGRPDQPAAIRKRFNSGVADDNDGSAGALNRNDADAPCGQGASMKRSRLADDDHDNDIGEALSG